MVDVDFGGNLATMLALIAVNGSIAYYATKGNPTPTITASELMRKHLSVHGVLLNGAPHAARKRAQRDVVEWLQEDGMRHAVSDVFPLSRTAAAHEALEFRPKLGTVVVNSNQLG